MREYREDDGRTTFHYHRDERLAARGQDGAGCSGRGSNRSRRRSLIIVLIDMAVILIIYAVITTFVVPGDRRTTIGGAHAVLLVQSLGDEDRYVVRLVAPQSARLEPDRSPPLVSVVFFEGETAVSDEILDLLPERAGEERVIDLVRPAGAPEVRVRARIRMDDEELMLEAVR